MPPPARYPRFSMVMLPPDPRRKSPNLIVYSQESRYAPLKVFCTAACIERGKARPSDNGCRHTDLFFSQVRPWYRARARVVGVGDDSAT